MWVRKMYKVFNDKNPQTFKFYEIPNKLPVKVKFENW